MKDFVLNSEGENKTSNNNFQIVLREFLRFEG